MALFIFKDQDIIPNQQLHGTLCGITYRVRGGQTFGWIQQPNPLPISPTKKQIEAHRKQTTLFRSIAQVQELMLTDGDGTLDLLQFVANQYHKIYVRIERLYNKHASAYTNDEQLCQVIMEAYRSKFLPIEHL